MSIRDNYLEILRRKDEAVKKSGRNPEDVTLLAVTKKHESEELQEALDAGATDFGENKVQELLSKYDDVHPMRWHLIGHLQTNKVRQIIDKVTMIHSVDSLKLAKEINKRAAAKDIVMDILIEINLAEEDSKTGVSKGEVYELIKTITRECESVRVRGIMCIPPRVDKPEDSRVYFRETKAIFDNLVELELPKERAHIDTLSMGMSADFEIAIEEGATIVRVGSSIFGQRNYR
nr:YggS family pyridoxal phosphate-dependent enzyme [uncultured Mogibacterium sp.]